MEWVQIGDTTWICIGGTCSQTQQSAEEAAFGFGEGMFFDPSDLYTGAEEYQFVGRETVNGIDTRHYTLSLSPALVAAYAKGDVTDMEAEAWVADEASLPAFVVRFRIYVKAGGDEPGEWNYSYEIYDVNTPFTIEPPEGAATFPEDVPQYPNAHDMTLMENMISFSTPDDAATVADFYRTNLADMGWTQESDQEMSGMMMQTWTKEGRTLQLMITPGDGETLSLIHI